MPDLDAKIREAVEPILELDEEEMVVDVFIVYTTVGPDEENLYYMATSKLPHWKALGMLAGAKSIIEFVDND